ncbi:MAG: hypothetical protein GXX99_01195 [Clostridiales bacterium]|nr:hypothetical protein [Clostridiales bacterium]
MKKKYVIELGTGVDMHGGDMTKAAQRALRDAVSHGSLAGLRDLAGVTDFLKQVSLEVLLAVPQPEALDVDEAIAGLPPYEQIEVKVVQGGLYLPNESLTGGRGDPITVACAAVTVLVEV